MVLQRWEPFYGMHGMRHAMNDLLRESLLLRAAGQSAQAAMDVCETEDSYRIEMALPGFRPDEVDISVEGDLLRISAEKQEAPAPEQRRYLLREREEEVAERTIRLPGDVQAENAEAEFEDGMLRLRLPKAEHARPRRIQLSGVGQQQRVAPPRQSSRRER